MVNEKKILLDSLKFFNRLIIFAQRDMTVEASLQYELTPFPLSLFSNKDQKMNKVNKAEFSKTSMKVSTNPLDLSNEFCCILVIDGGWLLYMVTWKQHQTWQEIATVTWATCSVWAAAPRRSLWSLGSRTILRQYYIATALYCDSTILRQHYIATNMVLSQYRAQNALYCDSTILR